MITVTIRNRRLYGAYFIFLNNGKLFQNYCISPDRKPFGHYGPKRSFQETSEFSSIMVAKGFKAII